MELKKIEHGFLRLFSLSVNDLKIQDGDGDFIFT